MYISNSHLPPVGRVGGGQANKTAPSINKPAANADDNLIYFIFVVFYGERFFLEENEIKMKS